MSSLIIDRAFRPFITRPSKFKRNDRYLRHTAERTENKKTRNRRKLCRNASRRAERWRERRIAGNAETERRDACTRARYVYGETMKVAHSAVGKSHERGRNERVRIIRRSASRPRATLIAATSRRCSHQPTTLTTPFTTPRSRGKRRPPQPRTKSRKSAGNAPRDARKTRAGRIVGFLRLVDGSRRSSPIRPFIPSHKSISVGDEDAISVIRTRNNATT